MLVQAKVLDNWDQEYPHIDRKIGNTGVRQIDQLLATAAARGIPAVYVFYNHLDDPTRVPIDGCECWPCLDCWGCSVALGTAVRALLPDKSFENLRSISHPWWCLLCEASLGATDSSDAPDRAARTLEYMQTLSRGIVADRVPILELPPLPDVMSHEPPDYFRQIDLLVGADSALERSTITAHIAANNPGVDGVVTITDAPPPD
jgi:hypothetical protein